MSEGSAGLWVTDTVAFTHLARAGHLDLLERLAPDGVVLVPLQVNDEIEAGRAAYPSIPAIETLSWVRLVVPSDVEDWTMLEVKAQLGGDRRQNLGESAVIAVVEHRGGVAILDDAAARAEADFRGVRHLSTLWIIVEGYRTVLGHDRAATEQVIDDLIATGMRLPVASGSSLFAWAWEQGLLP